MGFPEWFVISWMGIGWVCTCILHGKRWEGKYDAWRELAKLLILGVMLYWGGFFA